MGFGASRYTAASRSGIRTSAGCLYCRPRLPPIDPCDVVSGDRRMYSLLILSALSFLFCLVLTPLVRDLAIRMSLVDEPDAVRKLHRRAVPRLGGAPVFLSYAGSFLVLIALPLQAGQLIQTNSATIVRLLPAVSLVFLTGLLDDCRDLKPWQKLTGLVAGAVWAFAAGVRIPNIGAHVLPEWASLLITVGWLILCSNAFNLIDGV